MPPILRTSKMLPGMFRSKEVIFMINKTGIIKLLVKTLKAIPAIAVFRYLFLRCNILSSAVRIFFLLSFVFLNSAVSILDRSIVLPSLLVRDNSINPTPEINATGVMLD